MAKEVLKKVEEQLSCSICLDTYTDPKLLQCFHTYCHKCLVPLVGRDQRGQLSLTCPTCRQVTPVPDRGVAGLQSAFHINHLLEIRESLQNPAATPEGDGSYFKKANYCSIHEGMELELYCETCGELICWRCTVLRGGRHHDHSYEELDEAFEKYKNEVTSLLEPMEKQVMIVKKALVTLDTFYGKVSQQKTTVEDNIHATFDQLQVVLSARKTELINQLDQITQKKLNGLAAQKSQIEITLKQLNSCLHFTQESLKTCNKGGVVMMKRNTIKQMHELTTPLQSEKLEPNVDADKAFSASPDVTTQCRNYGELITLNLLPDHSKCYVAGKGTEVAVVGEKSSAILHVVNIDGKPSEKQIKLVECKLLSEITGINRASFTVERRGQGQYEISYQPTIKGRHQLHIKIEGLHIKGSPFFIAVKSSGDELDTPIRTLGGVVTPWGVTVNHRGEVIVTTWGARVSENCVSVFSPSGKKLRSFGRYGSGPGEFVAPCGVAVDGGGNILVVDNGNHRIQRFTTEGRYSTSVGRRGSGSLRFLYPTDIALNASNDKVYVVDSDNYRVQVLNSDLTFSGTFGKKGKRSGDFGYPSGIACDSIGKVYVTYSDNHRIQVFTADGKFLTMFERHAQGRGELCLYRHVGVAVDTCGMVCVGELGHHRVSVYTPEGHIVATFGKKGEEIHYPNGLAVDHLGIVYVCDKDKNCVQLFY